MSNVHHIGRSNSVLNILDQLREAAGTEELIAIRSYRDENGERQMAWYYSPLESRLWAAGALLFVANRIQNDE